MPFPDPDTWVADQRDAFFNGNTKRLRDCIELGADCRFSILAELAVGRIYGCVRSAVKLAQSMILTGKSNDFRTVRRMVPPPLPAPAGTGSKMPRDFRDVRYFKKGSREWQPTVQSEIEPWYRQSILSIASRKRVRAYRSGF